MLLPWEEFGNTLVKKLNGLADININGVLNGIRYFVPSMIKNHEKSRIINTASVAGLHSYANMGLVLHDKIFCRRYYRKSFL